MRRTQHVENVRRKDFEMTELPQFLLYDTDGTSRLSY